MFRTSVGTKPLYAASTRAFYVLRDGTGRKALYEALIVDEDVAHELQGRPTPENLWRLMIEKGETTLLEKAVREAAHG